MPSHSRHRWKKPFPDQIDRSLVAKRRLARNDLAFQGHVRVHDRLVAKKRPDRKESRFRQQTQRMPVSFVARAITGRRTAGRTLRLLLAVRFLAPAR
jgi:hypothetical protein